jgi:hypothetical protein
MALSLQPESSGTRTNESGHRRLKMSQTIEEKNKPLVLEAFDALFNRRD